ncbi:MAG: hypothetical protein AVDCRST_MAG96-2673 [uncultured Segetibacter sp.]|uniref:Uncharacterized protein n=1 Tax=uncultured Segetibacter sp. TaxID=481133 RepID=A0A6J4T7X9_9BACT|nr:MAG: hypothetical protein AVDCRST_MAG96-2673 [uncultured Segetibacter sp.]
MKEQFKQCFKRKTGFAFCFSFFASVIAEESLETDKAYFIDVRKCTLYLTE